MITNLKVLEEEEEGFTIKEEVILEIITKTGNGAILIIEPIRRFLN